jgi:hypothetical protein
MANDIIKRRPFEASADAKLLADLLRKAQPGETVEYQTMNDLIRGNVQGDDRGKLYTAMKWLRDEDGILFQCIPKQGYVRLTDQQAAENLGRVATKKTQEAAKRGLQNIRAINVAQVDENGRVEMAMRGTMLSIQYYAGKDATGRKLLPKVRDSGHDLPTKEALDIMRE